MAIDNSSAVGSIQHGDFNAFEDVKAKTEAMDAQVGGASERFGNTPDVAHNILTVGDMYADFAGFDAANRGNFDAAINSYISDVKSIIAGFDAQSDAILSAFKGKVAGSLTGFFTSIKHACNSYVDAINEEKDRVLEAEENWLRATESISSNIDEDSDAIRPVVIN